MDEIIITDPAQVGGQAGGNPTPPTQPTVTVVEKTFTQKDVDDIVINRLAKERAKIYKQIGIEDETKIEDYKTRVKEYDTLKQENESFKTEKQARIYQETAKKLNVDDDFVEFVLSKVEKNEKFEENLTNFLKEHPKYLKDTYKKVDSNLPLNGGSNTPDLSKMSQEEYNRWRSQNK